MGACGYCPFQSDTAWDWKAKLFKNRGSRAGTFRSPAEVSKMIDETLERATSDKRWGAEEARVAAAFVYIFNLPKKKKAIKALKRIMLNSRWVASWKSVDKILNAIKNQIEDLGGEVDIKEARAKANSERKIVWQAYLNKLAKDGPSFLGGFNLNILERSRRGRYSRRARLKRRKK